MNCSLSNSVRSTLGTLALLVLATTLTGQAAAQDREGSMMSRAYLHAYNIPSSGLAIEGYCPVSYFTVGRAVPGDPQHRSTFNSVTYYFASARYKQMFDADAEKYIPAFGGWCAFGMAIQDKFPIDPTNFKIVDDRLFLFLRNRNVDALAVWNTNDERTQVLKADAHWMKVSQ